MPISVRSHPAPLQATADDAEAGLLARAATDRDAFAPIYARYLNPIYGYCFHRLGDREAAEDATAQTFSQALAAVPTYRGGSVAGWLFAIAHRVVLNTGRQRRTHEPLDAAAEIPDPGSTPEELAVTRAGDEAARALLAQLPDDQRRVVELRLAGLTGAEIAEVLDRSLGAVKMLQLRAMTRLRLDPRVRAARDGAADGTR